MYISFGIAALLAGQAIAKQLIGRDYVFVTVVRTVTTVVSSLETVMPSTSTKSIEPLATTTLRVYSGYTSVKESVIATKSSDTSVTASPSVYTHCTVHTVLSVTLPSVDTTKASISTKTSDRPVPIVILPSQDTTKTSSTTSTSARAVPSVILFSPETSRTSVATDTSFRALPGVILPSQYTSKTSVVHSTATLPQVTFATTSSVKYNPWTDLIPSTTQKTKAVTSEQPKESAKCIFPYPGAPGC